MRRKLAAGMLALFLMLRLLPDFAVFWGKWISLPLLEALSRLGGRLDFVLLETWALLSCLLAPGALFSRGLRRFISGMLCGILLIALTAWYPLYFRPRDAVLADQAQLAALCVSLIGELEDASFPEPENMPAKQARLPFWMDALDLNGLCAFFTGEAIVHPALPPQSKPFVAVHERMHLSGHAPEGSANIAAWEDCMSRGGVYADSARLWALRYAMGALRRKDEGVYMRVLARMNHPLLVLYREAGGAYGSIRIPSLLENLYSFLGIDEAASDYEILVHHLAAGLVG